MAPTDTSDQEAPRTTLAAQPGSLVDVVLSGRFDELFPTFGSSLDPLQRRALFRLKGREAKYGMRTTEEHYFGGWERRHERELVKHQRLKAKTVNSYDTLARAIMLVAKGERNPKFYLIDTNVKSNSELGLEFPVLAETGLAMAYSLRETGKLDGEAITDLVFRYLGRHCLCDHMVVGYTPEKKPSDSTGVVGVRI